MTAEVERDSSAMEIGSPAGVEVLVRHHCGACGNLYMIDYGICSCGAQLARVVLGEDWPPDEEHT